MIRSTPGVPDRAVTDPGLGGRGRGLAEQQALGLQGEDHRDHDEQQADHRRAGHVEVVVPGDQREGHGQQREQQAGQCGHVLEQDDRELGLPGSADELDERRIAPDLVGLGDGGPQREALEHDGDAEHHERHPPPPAGVLVVAVADLLELVERLVEGEEATHGEQHDRHDERIDVTVPAVAERVLLVGLPLGRPAADQQEHLVAGVRDGVDRLGEHRADPGQQERDELRDRDPGVRGECGEHRARAAVCRHPVSLGESHPRWGRRFRGPPARLYGVAQRGPRREDVPT